jgi:hypothetical protein
MHDGGTALLVKVNNQTVCQSEAQYAKGGKEAGTWDALSGMSICSDLIPVKKGDQLSIVAKYDLDLHPARSHADGGGDAEEMGLALFSFATNTEVATRSFSSFLSDMTGFLGTVVVVPVVSGIGAGLIGATAPFMALLPKPKSAVVSD